LRIVSRVAAAVERDAGTAELISNGRQPWALPAPFNSQDIGTSRWQFL
jgi:hypothetical protein